MALTYDLIPKAREKEDSRDRDYTRSRTFWRMIPELIPELTCRQP
jgi:hypothetical protein